ncbi:IS3 family transposase [Microbulbifer aggregans]|uniref:IS3 family transposase n=1 Tax=Microbulbifer aggregans TaxID=1769779 RepID=UPI00299E4ECB|nr:IS3 family transposase [Microbulbifer aggregans]
MKYAYVDSLKGEYSVVKMCRWLSVSRAGYYKWRNRGLSPRAQRTLLVEKAVVTTFKQFKERYGAPRLVVELNEAGIPCSANHVAQLLAKNGLKARNGKGYKYFPSPNATNHVSDNLLVRDFTASKPNEKWVSDITYIKIEKGFVYLAVIMDLFSRKIIVWSLDNTMTNQLIMDAFEMAVTSRKVEPGLILHSDRGVQYRSREYQELLLNEGVQPSMSRKGNCWDNAAMESFLGRMKVESIYAEEFASKQEALSCIFEYIEMFYNTVRRHSANDQVSPNEFEGAYFENCA